MQKGSRQGFEKSHAHTAAKSCTFYRVSFFFFFLKHIIPHQRHWGNIAVCTHHLVYRSSILLFGTCFAPHCYCQYLLPKGYSITYRFAFTATLLATHCAGHYNTFSCLWLYCSSLHTGWLRVPLKREKHEGTILLPNICAPTMNML